MVVYFFNGFKKKYTVLLFRSWHHLTGARARIGWINLLFLEKVFVGFFPQASADPIVLSCCLHRFNRGRHEASHQSMHQNSRETNIRQTLLPPVTCVSIIPGPAAYFK